MTTTSPAVTHTHKTRAKLVQIPGTKPSIQNNQLLISTGVPSLDGLLGGGVAVGTVFLIEEDTYGSYSKVLLKYFLAEGISNGHSLLIASADVPPDNILKELPVSIADCTKTERIPQDASDDSKMMIAWRYQKSPQTNAQIMCGSRYGNYYDLTKHIDESHLNGIDTRLFYLPEQQLNSDSFVMNPTYAKLLKSIEDYIEENHYSTSCPSQTRNILRIGIHSLASPLWGENGISTQQTDHSLPRFLYALRAQMRKSFACCLLTIPSHLLDDVTREKIERLSDTVVHIDSFAGSDKETNPLYKEYHGLFHIKKLPRINSLVCHTPDCLDLAFKLRRKKFSIEKLHLPPELSETVSRSQEDPLTSIKRTGCTGTTSGGKTKLDF